MQMFVIGTTYFTGLAYFIYIKGSETDDKNNRDTLHIT